MQAKRTHAPHLIPRERWRWLTNERVRELDRRAIEQFAVPSIVLMENAGAGAAWVAMEMLEGAAAETADSPRAVAILCGGGNNGGDGLVMARHLHNRGVDPVVALAGRMDRLRGDAAVNGAIVRRMGMEVIEEATPERLDRAVGRSGPAVVVDALLGTGLRDVVRGETERLIAWIDGRRSGGSLVLAVDVPSGMDCDSGEPLGRSVRADVTATFAGPKIGFARPSGRGLVGQVAVVDIGAPAVLAAELGVAAPPATANAGGGETLPTFGGY